jgi:hypothetical protein
MREHDDRQLRSFHEASHGLMAALLGQPVRLMSIRPTEHYGGRMLFGDRRAVHVDPKLLLVPVIRWPARARRMLEVELFVSLAGPVGELFVPHSRFGTLPDERHPERAAQALARLGPRTRAALAASERNAVRFPNDDETAHSAAVVLAGQQEAGAYLGWARIAVQRLLAEHVWKLAAVGDALYTREVSSGHQMRALLARQRKERRAA